MKVDQEARDPEEEKGVLTLQPTQFCHKMESKGQEVRIQIRPNSQEGQHEEQERVRESWNCHKMVNHFSSNCPEPKKSRSSQAAGCNCEECVATGKGLPSEGEGMENFGPRRIRVKGTWTPESKTRRGSEPWSFIEPRRSSKSPEEPREAD